MGEQVSEAVVVVVEIFGEGLARTGGPAKRRPLELCGDVLLQLQEQDGLADAAIADDEVDVGTPAGPVAQVGEESVDDRVAARNVGWIDPVPGVKRVDIRRHIDVTHNPSLAVVLETYEYIRMQFAQDRPEPTE